MNDPRDQRTGSEGELTESSSDELADLQKEFEVRRQKILENKLKKKKADVPEKHVVRSPSPERATNRYIGPPPAKSKTSFLKETIPDKKKEPDNRSKIESRNEPSQFFNKLHQSSQHAPKAIDYETREFLFDIPPPQEIAVEEKEQFSSQYIRKRYITHDDLNRVLENKKVLKLDRMYAKITAPAYTEPAYANWCVIGIITAKKDPKLTKSTAKEKGSKYLKITISDLNLTVDLMIFGDAFKKYWKLRIGDVICVLNPDVNAWKPPFNGFNLSISDGVDSIVEIGSSRDFGHCTMVKKDNTRCTSVINTSKSDLCNYHQEIKYKQSQNKRMELSGSVNLKSPTNKHGQKLSMYLSTNQNGKVSGGYLNYEKINQQTVNYCQEGGKIGDAFVNPKLLDNMTVKRRKHNDSKNNLLLEKKLLKLLNNSNFKKLGLIKSTDQPEPQLNKTAFNTSILNKIGFDPTTNNVTSIHTSPQKKRKQLSSDLQELYEISSHKQAARKLTSSTDDKLMKKNKWRSNLKTLNQYKQRYESDPHGPSAGPPDKHDVLLQSPIRVKNRKINISDSDTDHEQNRAPQGLSHRGKSHHLHPQASSSSPSKSTTTSFPLSDTSDSDIEISFDSKSIRDQYHKIIQKST